VRWAFASVVADASLIPGLPLTIHYMLRNP
jgi:hypothetical protein